MHTASCALNLLQREKNREEIREGEVGGGGGGGKINHWSWPYHIIWSGNASAQKLRKRFWERGWYHLTPIFNTV